MLDLEALDRAEGASAFDSLGVEQYSLGPAIGVGIADPHPLAVCRRLAQEGKSHGRLGGRQPRPGLGLRTSAFVGGGLLPGAQG